MNCISHSYIQRVQKEGTAALKIAKTGTTDMNILTLHSDCAENYCHSKTLILHFLWGPPKWYKIGETLFFWAFGRDHIKRE